MRAFRSLTHAFRHVLHADYDLRRSPAADYHTGQLNFSRNVDTVFYTITDALKRTLVRITIYLLFLNKNPVQLSIKVSWYPAPHHTLNLLLWIHDPSSNLLVQLLNSSSYNTGLMDHLYSATSAFHKLNFIHSVVPYSPYSNFRIEYQYSD